MNEREEREEMIQIHTKLGVLDEKTRSLTERLAGFERSIDERLIKIDEKLKDNHKNNEVKLQGIEDKIDSFFEVQNQTKGFIKAILFVGSGVVVVGGILAWFVDRWSVIKNAII